MFDLIPRNAASASIVDPSEGTYQGSEEIFRKSEEAVKDAGRWITDSTGVSELVSGRAADKAAKKAKRALEREGKKVLNTMKEDMLRPPGTPRPNRGGFDALRNASTMSEADSEAARRIKGGDFPDSREYPIGFGLFKQIINDVADGMIDYGKDLEKWKAKGGSFKPPINPEKEAANLREVIPAIEKIFSENPDMCYPPCNLESEEGNDKFVIFFNEVKKKKKVGGKKSKKTITTIAGCQPDQIIYYSDGIGYLGQDGLVGSENFNKPPWNNPRTMAYLFNIEKMWADLGKGNRGACGKELTPGVSFFIKYTYPSLSFKPSSPTKKKQKIDMMGPIKNSVQKLEEDIALTAAQKWKELTQEDERKKIYTVGDVLPGGEICELDKLFQEFLDVFDVPALFCQYAACVPDFPWPPQFNWNFQFSLPSLPKLPTFDPLGFLNMQIEITIIDLIVGLLCGIIRGILDILGKPNCQDLLDFGAAAFEFLTGDGDNLDGKVALMKKAESALDEMEIPTDSYADIADLFDTAALALTPSELCSLLNGTASSETLTILKEIVMKHYSGLKEYLNNEADLELFFSVLGEFVDPEMCQRMSRMSEVILGDVMCPESETDSLRSRLESAGATPEEISKSIIEAQKRREAIKSLLDEDPLKNILPRTGCPEGGGIAGPYDNPSQERLTKLAAKGVYDQVEYSFRSDLSGFVPGLYTIDERPSTNDDVDHNLLADLQFRHLMDQLTALGTTSGLQQMQLIAEQSVKRSQNFNLDPEDPNSEPPSMPPGPPIYKPGPIFRPYTGPTKVYPRVDSIYGEGADGELVDERRYYYYPEPSEGEITTRRLRAYPHGINFTPPGEQEITVNAEGRATLPQGWIEADGGQNFLGNFAAGGRPWLSIPNCFRSHTAPVFSEVDPEIEIRPGDGEAPYYPAGIITNVDLIPENTQLEPQQRIGMGDAGANPDLNDSANSSALRAINSPYWKWREFRDGIVGIDGVPHDISSKAKLPEDPRDWKLLHALDPVTVAVEQPVYDDDGETIIDTERHWNFIEHEATSRVVGEGRLSRRRRPNYQYWSRPAAYDFRKPEDARLFLDIISRGLNNQTKTERKIVPEIRKVLQSERSSRLEQKDQDNRKHLIANIDMDVSDNSTYEIVYEEKPFSGTQTKDCYSITRHRRNFRMDDSLGQVTLLYNDPIPETFLAMRRDDRDINDARYTSKLARPAAFAEMILQSWSGVLDLIPDQARLISTVDAADAVDAGGAINLGDLLNQALENAQGGEEFELNKDLIGSSDSMLWKKLQSYGPSDRLKLKPRTGQVGIAMDTLHGYRNAPSAYDYVADGFLAKISKSVAKSRYFNLSEISEIERKLT